jgi:HD-GYP domain-containing protein (c-di-GMP phosphodiesterase class II)
MPVIPVSQAQVGDRLNKDVQTALGSILMEEGRILSERDLEILQAFLIPTVDISRSGAEDLEAAFEETSAAVATATNYSSLQHEFIQMEKVLKRTFTIVESGMKLPVLEVRNGLRSLLNFIDDYNVITFKPPKSMYKDDYLIRNSVLCAMTSYLLAKWTKFPEKDWMQIAMAGLLHDIGNVRVDPAILNKTTRLTQEEIQEIRQHTVYGFKLLENGTALNQGVWLTALQHHERIDGSGYPMKVKGDKIHPYAKIVAIADVYHAMTSSRKYRKAKSPYLVLEELMAEAFGKLDPVYVQTFVEKATQLHYGVFVKLNDGRVGEIVFTDRNYPTRPMISIHGTVVNLIQERDLHIVEVFAS